MPIRLDGSREPRDAREILTDIRRGLQAQFGRRVNVTPSGTPGKLAEAVAGTTLIQAEVELDAVMREMHPSEAGDVNMQKHLRDTLGFPPKLAARATGEVNITLKTSKSNADFNPMFAVGDIKFIDSNGQQYELTEDVVLGASPTTSATAKVRAIELGADGNIDGGLINNVAFGGNGTPEARWKTNVDSFTNNSAFSGGQDDETPTNYLRRFQAFLAARPVSSASGVVTSVARIAQPDAVFIKENTDDVPTADDKVYESTASGTGSETINSAGGAGVATKIAQKISIPNWRFIHRIKSKLQTDTALVGTFRIESDNAGSPSGNLLKTRYDRTASDFDGTNESSFDFTNGDYPAAIDGAFPITAWIVFVATSGSGKFQGDNSGAAGDVKVYKDAAWSNDANINKMFASVIAGIPPRSFRLLVDVTADKEADVAEAIALSRTAGILGDGKNYKSVTIGAQTVNQPYELATNVSVVIDITVKRKSSITGTDDAKVKERIKDIIVRYVGGTDSNGVKFNGLGFNESIIRMEIIHQVLDDDNILGTTDVTLCRIGRLADYATPDLLTSGQEQNLDPTTPSERFRIGDIVNDIRVTLAEA